MQLLVPPREVRAPDATIAGAGSRMRDQPKSRHSLAEEVIHLRKQVDDLRGSLLARRRVEDALRESETLLRSMLLALPVPVACLDTTGHLLLANDALATLLGYDSRQDLLQLGDVLGLFADREEEKQVLARLDPPPGTEIETRCRRKPGGSIAVRLGAVKLAEAGGPEDRLVVAFAASSAGPDPLGAADRHGDAGPGSG